MSFAWHEIRDHLMQSSSTLRFQHSLDILRCDHPALQRFLDPAAVLEYLHRGHDAPECKNDVLAALVLAANTPSQTAKCAQTLLLLALWPGLDAVRRRLIWRWKRPPEDVAADVMAAACDAIAAMDLSRVNRIAATLLRNVERDIGRALRREADLHEQHAAVDPEQLTFQATTDQPNRGAGHVAREVKGLIGRDAGLVLAVAWDEQTQAEAGAALGLSEAVARKRFQRATRRLRDALQEIP